METVMGRTIGAVTASFCSNVLAILDDSQKGLLKDLAVKEAPQYSQAADKRLVLIKAFRQTMDPISSWRVVAAPPSPGIPSPGCPFSTQRGPSMN